MLKLHEWSGTADNYDGGCIAYLDKAVEVRLERKINDIYSLYFDYPCADEKAALITENQFVELDGQYYVILKIQRVTDGKDMLSVTAADVFSTYGRMTHIQNIPDNIGVKPSNVFKNSILKSPFTAFTEAELDNLGMTWLDNDGYKIDFFSTDKTNAWEATQTIIENSGYGEIYRDNFKVAIVKKLGKDNGVRLSLEKNMDSLTIVRDFENVITRLYPYGSDDVHIGSVNNGKQYIDSPNIDKYGIREGYKDYSDYTAPEKIMAHAQWEFDADNDDRIDEPKVTITGGFIDLSKLEEYGDIEKIDIGDMVHVYDNDGKVYDLRVVSMTTYPFEPKKPTIEIGHIEVNAFSYIWQLGQMSKKYNKSQTTNSQIASRSLSGVVNTDRNTVTSDNELLQIVNDLLTIYDTKTSNERLTLGNVGNKFALNVYDENGNLKIKLGDYGSTYAFAIYDNKGNASIYMDEGGDVSFAGTLKTKKDALVGAELTVGQVNECPIIHMQGTEQDICIIKSSGEDDKYTKIDTAGYLILKSVMGLYKDSVSADNALVTKEDMEDYVTEYVKEQINKSK
jgi:hypothetical protein